MVNSFEHCILSEDFRNSVILTLRLSERSKREKTWQICDRKYINVDNHIEGDYLSESCSQQPILHRITDNKQILRENNRYNTHQRYTGLIQPRLIEMINRRYNIARIFVYSNSIARASFILPLSTLMTSRNCTSSSFKLSNPLKTSPKCINNSTVHDEALTMCCTTSKE